jgi:type IV pilus assembly protein PilV
MMQGPDRAMHRQHGVTLLEILVTIVITAFGLLGLAGFIARSAAATVESNQRARAAALLVDMENRIRNNKAHAAEYVSPTVVHGAAAQDCTAVAAGAQRDLCEWNNLLVGVNDALAVDDGLTKLAFRGCITRPAAPAPVYVITVAWGSSMLATPPADPCGADLFGDDGFRRIIRTQVRVPTLA